MRYAFLAINSQYIHSCLAIQGLAVLARPYGEVLYYDFNVNQDYRSLLMSIPEADTYFFSCYIWNRQMILALMKDLKRLYPNAKLYVGGPEAQGTPDDFLVDGDGVFLGEGETPLLRFLQGEVPESLHTKDHTGVIARESHLTFEYPFELVDPTKIIYYETQRGCPYHCSYCLSAEVNQLVDAPLEKVKADLTRLANEGHRLIKLVDRSFNAKSQRCLDLLAFFGSLEQAVTFHVEMSPYGLTDEQLQAIAALPPDRLQVEIGFQALQPEILKKIDRPAYSPQVLDRLERLMALPLHRHIDLIVGLPGMSLSDVAETFNYLFSLKPDDLQVGFLKVLPGTPLYRRSFEFGLVASVQPPYEILKTKDVSFSELNTLKRLASLADWFNPANFPSTFEYLQLSNPFDFYLKLIDNQAILQEKGLEDRLRLVQASLGDEIIKEYLELDYHRQRRRRKLLFFADREVSLRQILDSSLLNQIKDRVPDLDDKQLNKRISVYRTALSQPYVMYDYQSGLMDYLEE